MAHESRVSGQVSVVTGGCGFVGRHLVDALVARGDQVRVVDLGKPHRDDVEFIKGDITDAEAMKQLVQGAASVFHKQVIEIGELKKYLAAEGIEIRQ